jgi:hypothetical protein
MAILPFLLQPTQATGYPYIANEGAHFLYEKTFDTALTYLTPFTIHQTPILTQTYPTTVSSIPFPQLATLLPQKKNSYTHQPGATTPGQLTPTDARFLLTQNGHRYTPTTVLLTTTTLRHFTATFTLVTVNITGYQYRKHCVF